MYDDGFVFKTKHYRMSPYFSHVIVGKRGGGGHWGWDEGIGDSGREKN